VKVVGLFTIIPLLSSAQTSVLTANYDNGRTNANVRETVLTTSNVKPALFGKTGAFPVDGQVYAQPLYAAGVTVGSGKHNLLLLATQHDSVYAYDADSAAGPTLFWHVNLGASVPSSTWVDFDDITPEVGILSTPVVDLTRGVVYLVAFTQEGSSLVYRLHALDLSTGAETLNGPAVVTASVPGNGAASEKGILTFDASMHLQRPGLLLANGAVYLAFGSHADGGLWHGWVISYDAANINRQLGVYCTTPNGMGASIWQSGRGLAADEAGSIYAITGNGDDDGNSPLSESFVKLTGASPVQADFYTPANAAWLDDHDYDLSAGASLIPGTHLVVGGDKNGSLYVVNGDSMGGTGGGAQVFQGVLWGGIFNFALWNRTDGAYLYVQEQGSILKAYRMTNGAFDPNAALMSTARFDSPFDGIAISANGTEVGSGILWTTSYVVADARHAGTLHAFDAASLAELWNSDMTSGPDSLGTFAKFVCPTVVNGNVYVATFSNSVAVYGLLPSVQGNSGRPVIALVSNVASNLSASVAPGEAVLISGTNFGPSSPVAMQFETTGSVSLTLGNTLVLFDGVPVPLTSVSSGQVTAIAPLGLKAATTKVQVQYGNRMSNGFSMPVAPATPGLFAVILNQDGTPNSASNPAAPGSVVSLFATGAGPVAPALQDGAIVTASNPQQLVLPVAVQIDGQQAAVVYAGGAPGIVQGISQINARLPDGLSDGALAVLLQAGGQTSQSGVTLAVRSEPLLPLVRR
jgi:uncharacterized protein (TIGR03437 family)